MQVMLHKDQSKLVKSKHILYLLGSTFKPWQDDDEIIFDMLCVFVYIQVCIGLLWAMNRYNWLFKLANQIYY